MGCRPPAWPLRLRGHGGGWSICWRGLAINRCCRIPSRPRPIAAARLKNDRVDAERLAVLLRSDFLPTVWIPPREIREARELLRHRVSPVWLRTRIKNGLLALLARRNLQPRSATHWLSLGKPT